MNFSSNFVALMVLVLIGTASCRTLLEPATFATAAASVFNAELIVGGRTVDISVYPHQVSLRKKDILHPDEPYSHTCGGSIYSKDIVITAAHCVIGEVPSQYQIGAGTSQRLGTDGAIAIVKEFIVHEDYSNITNDNDIALVVLATSLPINNFTIKPVQLAEEYSRNGDTATVTGWGALSFGGPLSNLLQAVQVPIISNELCNDDYDGLITDSMLCAGVRGVGGKDACTRDSGGPLLVNGKLAGVVSWGYGCADPNYPGVYANVTYLLPWILKKSAEVDSQLLLESVN